jgi:hypothetical protein
MRLMGAALLAFGAATGCAIAEDVGAVGTAAKDLPPGMEQLKAAMEKYRDPILAVHDGYFSTVGCVHFEAGTMGVHFLNPNYMGAVPDPMHPTALLYEPVGDRLELVAVEWLVPLASGVTSRPSIYGHPFDGPMEGHEPLLPAALHHYDLHAWIFKENPLGVFAAVNPNVKCPDGPYTYLETIKMLPDAGMSH